ncbi:MAG: 4a-hydroxytetrahydrobiopterin dehydratase [Actinobacteria bacterium]|nr:4a-hydroxytetrahydrobiopterin dehydratase [Actinomycetota bacterium]MTB28155.1 4a-hydroxytetrahydrobiopterin dehydratase [Actinomycetota bacterium]
MRPQLLTAIELPSQLALIPQWDSNGISISRNFHASSFPAVISWVVSIATESERVDHHPDLDIRWTTLHVILSSHDLGGLTQRDIDLAITIDLICR